MQFAFRFSHNYGRYVLSTEPKHHQPNRMLGDSIKCLRRGGESVLLPFAGVMDAKLLSPNHQKVKVTNLVAYSQDVYGLSGFIDVPNGYAVGVYLHQLVYLLIQDNAPVVISD